MEGLPLGEGGGGQDKKCLDQQFADRVAKLCHSKYASLPKTGKPKKDLEWTVLSAIVFRRESSSEMEVVSLATGSKCIGKTNMSPKGDILNDSHAEVLARRGFLRYLYHQIHLLKNASPSKTLFETADQKFAVRPDITFHLYCSHTPCGDASIFPRVTSSTDEDDFGACISGELKRTSDEVADSGTAKRLKHESLEISFNDIHRTGAKCVPDDTRQDEHRSGSGYHVLGAVRTKPGRGDPTLSVSCSDKLMRWNCVGLQGALLSLLLHKPVYLKSIIIGGGCPHSPDAMRRALVDRVLAAESHLPPNYVINPPVFFQSTIPFPDGKFASNAPQPCPSSVIWCNVPHRSLEVAVEGKKQGATKKSRNTRAGRLLISKVEFMRLFQSVKPAGLSVKSEVILSSSELKKDDEGSGSENVSHICSDVDPDSADCKISCAKYSDLKGEASEYISTWRAIRSAAKLGWTQKCPTLLDFLVDDDQNPVKNCNKDDRN